MQVCTHHYHCHYSYQRIRDLNVDGSEWVNSLPLSPLPLDVLANEVKRRKQVLTGNSGESVELRNVDLLRVVKRTMTTVMTFD